MIILAFRSIPRKDLLLQTGHYIDPSSGEAVVFKGFSGLTRVLMAWVDQFTWNAAGAAK